MQRCDAMMGNETLAWQHSVLNRIRGDVMQVSDGKICYQQRTCRKVVNQ